LQEGEYVNLIRDIQVTRRTIDESAKSIADISTQHSQVQYNQNLWENMIDCVKKPTIEQQQFNVSFDKFAEYLVETNLESIIECLRRIQIFIKSIEHE
jgi:hypothetical protein